MTGQRAVVSVASATRSSSSRSSSSHVAPVLGWMLSAFIVLVSVALSTPTMDDLVEVSGVVRTSAELTGARTQRDGVIFTLNDRPDRYWTGILRGYPVKSIPGSFVRTYVERTAPPVKSYGAAWRTWGLSIDGKTIESVEDALDTDRARKHVLLPVIGLVLAAVSLIGFLYEGRRPDRAPTLESAHRA